MKSFAELPGKQRAIEVLRWILVPAAAVLASLAPTIIAGWVIPRAVAQPPGTSITPLSEINRLLGFLMFYVIVGVAFVIAGARMAPRCRTATAIVLAVLWILKALWSHVLVHLSQGTPHYDHFAIEALAAAVGAAFIFYSERSKHRTPPAND